METQAKGCTALTETVDTITTDFINGLAEGGIEVDPTFKMVIVAAATALLLKFLGNEKHLAQTHDVVDLRAWRRRMHEEARLTLQALMYVGAGYEKNATLGAAASECAERAVVGGENVVLRLGEQGWYVYEMTEEDLAAHRSALERGDPVIRFPGEEPAQQQQFQLPLALQPREAAAKYLEDWLPKSKAN